jgi:hypothetical protein
MGAGPAEGQRTIVVPLTLSTPARRPQYSAIISYLTSNRDLDAGPLLDA